MVSSQGAPCRVWGLGFEGLRKRKQRAAQEKKRTSSERRHPQPGLEGGASGRTDGDGFAPLQRGGQPVCACACAELVIFLFFVEPNRSNSPLLRRDEGFGLRFSGLRVWVQDSALAARRLARLCL